MCRFLWYMQLLTSHKVQVQAIKDRAHVTHVSHHGEGLLKNSILLVHDIFIGKGAFLVHYPWSFLLEGRLA